MRGRRPDVQAQASTAGSGASCAASRSAALNLRRVLAHNDRDVATLAELLLHLSELTAADMDAAQETPLPAVEAWA